MQERGLTPYGLSKMKKYDVNRAGAVEAIWAPLYDTQTLGLAAGTTELIYFQVPQGQAGKTLDETNMEVAGSLPAPKEFLITSVQVAVYPQKDPGEVGVAAGIIPTNWNDVYGLSQSGHLRLFIGSKEYVVDAPLGKFPPRWWVAGSDAVSTGVVTDSSQIDYATFRGPIYEVVPYRLIPTQNFSVTLRWNSGGSPALVSNAVIRVVLGGFLYRLSQ